MAGRCDLRATLAPLAAADRALGAAIRRGAGARPALARPLVGAAGLMSPLFRAAVAALALAPATRRDGLRALGAAVAAALAARAARDRLDRRRPGRRSEGGLPSRHAAAGTAIALCALRSRQVPRPLAAGLAALAAIGLVGRVVSAEHDPADIAAGAALGAAVALGVTRAAADR